MIKKVKMAKSIVPTYSNTYAGSNIQFSSNGQTKTLIDENFNVHAKRLVLEDEDTGMEWEIRIKNGKLIAEPLDPVDKRNHKINKVINDK